MSAPEREGMTDEANVDLRHTLFEDLQAIITGALIISIGVAMHKQAGLLTGGITGVAFLIHYTWKLNFGLVLILLNLPFYVLAVRKLGWEFALKSLAAVCLVSTFTELSPHVLRFEWVHPVFSGITGGLLIGVGMLILFRHKGSLGGLNVLVLHLQETRGWKAGHLQMGFDFAIVCAAFFVVSPILLASSILGAFMLNLAIATNHRRDRYTAA
jgi:uncharacterized membrane-anchored protein YitT (DUF2179 family)